MSEYQLSREQRDSISADDLSMLILCILQRNHRDAERGSRTVTYYEYQLSSILEFEIASDQECALRGIERQFRDKFAQAVHILQHGGFIMPDPTQGGVDFQRPSPKGLQTDTTAPVLGITTIEEFLRKAEARSGPLDPVARAYLAESYAAAESNLWMSSIFMLGAAGERLIYVLADHIDHLLADPAASAALGGINSVRQRKEWIVSQLPALRRRLPAHRDAFSDVEDKFDSLYNAYRYQRNEAGHPRDTPFSPNVQQAKALLFSFEIYAQAVNAILAIP